MMLFTTVVTVGFFLTAAYLLMVALADTDVVAGIYGVVFAALFGWGAHGLLFKVSSLPFVEVCTGLLVMGTTLCLYGIVKHRDHSPFSYAILTLMVLMSFWGVNLM